MADHDANAELLRTTLLSIGDGVIATDKSGHIVLMNPVAERLTGWKLADARGRPLRTVFRIVNEQTRSRVESPVDRVLRDGPTSGLPSHTVLLASDGTEVPVRDSSAPMRDESGAVQGVVIVFRDASEEVRAAARRDLLAEAAATLSSSLDYRETLRKLARLMVPRLCDLCSIDVLEGGEPPGQVAVAHSSPLGIERTRELWKRHPVDVNATSGLGNVLRGGPSELHADLADPGLDAAPEGSFTRVMRELKLRSCVVVPLVLGPRVLGAMTLGFGESGRRYSQDDVLFAEELGRRAAMAIENARLYAVEQQARDVANEANRMKDEFLALVSHELRTPLAAILGWSRILSRPDLPEAKRARAVETIDRNANSMAQLIEDLLDVSRIVSGKLRLHMGTVEPLAIVEAVLESIRPAVDAKAIRIHKELDSGIGSIAGDPSRLQQVVWNLLSNAVKFTQAQGSVKVTLARRDPFVEITVTDDGKGIDPRFLPQVFELFQQSDGSMTRKTGGLGLGLSIVKHIVELHGGQVEATSEGSGKGATFIVRVPVAASRPAEVSPEVAAAAPAPPSSSAAPELSGLCVLVVEDEADMRELLSEALNEAGCKAMAAGSVAEAMRLLEKGPIPDVILSDIAMPGQSGYDLIRQVRALPAEKGGKCPAIALTAHARVVDGQRAIDAGFGAHVTKPIEPKELVRTIARLTGR